MTQEMLGQPCEASSWPTMRLWVDLEAIQHNYRCFQGLNQMCTVAAVLKANAYGLGVAPIGHALYQQGCRDFMVATIIEGVSLRRHLSEAAAIYVLHGITRASDVQTCLEHKLTPVLNTPAQLDLWHRHGVTQLATSPELQKLPAVLQVDTGMNRLGFAIDDFERLSAVALRQDLDVRYIFTHLACGTDPQHPKNQEQLCRFAQIRAKGWQTTPVSAAATSRLFFQGTTDFDMVRHGLSLYGIMPPETPQDPPPLPHSLRVGLNFALRLQAQILQVRHIEGGDTIGYGARYQAPSSRRIATLGMGYADGLPLCLSHQGGSVKIGPYTAPIVGEISMDLTTIDVTDVPPPLSTPQRWVDVFYDNVSLYELAKRSASSPHELLTRLGPRCQRLYGNQMETP